MFSHSQTDANLAALFNHAAHGKTTAAISILSGQPELLLQTGNFYTASGLVVRNVTVFEFALGSGHPILANAISACFDKLPNGVEIREQQYAKYRDSIANMLEQKPYDGFEKLFATLAASATQHASPNVNTLTLSMKHGAPLFIEIEKFRDYINSRAVECSSPGIHFNYGDILEFFKYYEMYLRALNYDQHQFACIRIFGAIMRNLTAYHRQATAAGYYPVVFEGRPVPETYEGKNIPGGEFPSTVDHRSRTGLGYEYFIDSFGCAFPAVSMLSGGSVWLWRTGLQKLQGDMQNIHGIDQASRPAPKQAQ